MPAAEMTTMSLTLSLRRNNRVELSSLIRGEESFLIMSPETVPFNFARRPSQHNIEFPTRASFTRSHRAARGMSSGGDDHGISI